ncbi:hypothetical protein LTR37_007543 [Vermiconidia calcicola]|uniref:Uncharacterized protein n=1 Tax=Vermiconidia calcicola TaxID=1690605 RepID=A0ACC3ND28_9PEZI|nr:hypothetical protein LTR37_007543 [Vermiconidia calcicola]
MSPTSSPINSQTPFPIDLGLKGSHALVTGGCGLIGKVVAHALLAAECCVSIVDITDDCPFDQQDANICYVRADITDAEQMDYAFAEAEQRFGPVEICVALASLDLSVLQQSESLADMDPKTWQRVFDVNVNGTFMTCQRWLRSIRTAASDPQKASRLRNVTMIIVGSESGRFGVRTMAAYAAGKSAVQQGLLHTLAEDAPRLYSAARVNAVAPGPVATERFEEERRRYGDEFYYRECQATVPPAKPVPPEDVARTILFLASQRFSGSVHGQLIPIDAGKTGNLVWTKEELAERPRTSDRS